jgi:hypothetical protein
MYTHLSTKKRVLELQWREFFKLCRTYGAFLSAQVTQPFQAGLSFAGPTALMRAEAESS